jgi:lipoprotein signal peptidase
MTGLALAGMSVFILINRKLRPALVTGISLVIGGGVGNLTDRVFNNGAAKVCEQDFQYRRRGDHARGGTAYLFLYLRAADR